MCKSRIVSDKVIKLHPYGNPHDIASNYTGLSIDKRVTLEHISEYIFRYKAGYHDLGVMDEPCTSCSSNHYIGFNETLFYVENHGLTKDYFELDLSFEDTSKVKEYELTVIMCEECGSWDMFLM